MADFLLSPQGTTAVIIIGILAIVGYIVLTVVDELITTDFDPVTEEKCKKCIHYDYCIEHGCQYNCYYYCTKEMQEARGLDKHD